MELRAYNWDIILFIAGIWAVWLVVAGFGVYQALRRRRNAAWVCRQMGGRGGRFTVDGIPTRLIREDGLVRLLYDWQPPAVVEVSSQPRPTGSPLLTAPDEPKEMDEFTERFRVTSARSELAREVLDEKTRTHFAEMAELASAGSVGGGVALQVTEEGLEFHCGGDPEARPQDLFAFIEHANAIFRRYREVMQPLTKMSPPARVPEDSRCPLCDTELREDLVACSGCRTLYHAECRRRARKCVMPGCAGDGAGPP